MHDKEATMTAVDYLNFLVTFATGAIIHVFIALVLAAAIYAIWKLITKFKEQ